MTSATQSHQAQVAWLYGRYGPAIFSRCRRLLGDDALAEDATQEVFLRLLDGLDDLPSDERQVRWIHRVATNHCFNLRRDRRRHAQPVAELPDRVDDFDLGEAVADRALAGWVLGHAPAQLREPIRLFWGEERTSGEVAAAMGVSRRTLFYRLEAFRERARRVVTSGT